MISRSNASRVIRLFALLLPPICFAQVNMTGKWHGSTRPDSILRLHYVYVFDFRSDGSFSYDLRQIVDPVWSMHVEGTWKPGGKLPGTEGQYTSSVRLSLSMVSYSRGRAPITEADLPESQFLIMDENGIPWGKKLSTLATGSMRGQTLIKIPGSCSGCGLWVDRIGQ